MEHNRSDYANSMARTTVYDPCETGVPTLIAFSQAGHVDDFAIAGECVIGRHDGDFGGLEAGQNAIGLPIAIASRRHGKVGMVGERCFYRDEGSTHGTLLNGVTCEGAVELHPGDTLGFAPNGVASSTLMKLIFCYTARGRLYWNRIPLTDGISTVSIGRTPDAGGIALSDEHLSRRHALFELDFEGDAVQVTVIDAGSANGVFVNGRLIEGSAPVGFFDIVRIGDTWVVRLADELWVGSDYPALATSAAAKNIDAEPESEPAITKPTMQAQPSPAMDSSVSGDHRADVSDVSRAGDQQAVHLSEDFPTASSLVIDIRERSVKGPSGPKTLLKDVRLRINPGDFVLVLGGSGAGKTTFLNAVMGNDKADGSVYYGDLDVYVDYDQIKYDIGYVPQKDLVRLNDSVRYTLYAAAQLRMPSRSSRDECRARAEWAAEMLGLIPEMDTIVGRLSGGQLKRLSSAIELVGDPSLFFLDEPDSGLDGMMARSLMTNLRSIADLGKVVVVITHGPDRVAHLFTKVLVLAKSEREGSGQMAFFGTVDEAKGYFGTDSLEGVVSKINRRDEGGEGLADYFIDKWKELRQ